MIQIQPEQFHEKPAPQLSKLFMIRQPQQELISQHWKYLISTIQIQSQNQQKNVYLIYKQKYNIAFSNYLQGCLLYQRKFKILYAQVKDITCIKLHAITINYNGKKSKGVIICIGFIDGNLQIYHLILTQKSVVLKKLIMLESQAKNKPVVSILFNRSNMLVSITHKIVIYKNCVNSLASLLIQNQSSEPQSKIVNFQSVLLAVGDMAQGSAIYLSGGLNHIFVYNETHGSKTFKSSDYTEVDMILDSLTFVKETLEENLIIADTDNKLKMIYKQKKKIRKYRGFKNYCSSIVHLLFDSYEQIWVGDYNGCLTYFQRQLNTSTKSKEQENQSENKLGIKDDINIRYTLKLCDYGIKQIRISDELLIILDAQSNITIFDIIRKDKMQNYKTIQVQQMQG